MKRCSVDGCDSEVWCRDVCQKHYMQLRRSGAIPSGTRARGSVHERVQRFYSESLPDSCWEWTSTRNNWGYGLIAVGAKGAGQLLAHRVQWERVNNRKIPRGKVILHICDNPPCVNPAHLLLGTQKQNMRDMLEKRRNSPIPRPRGTSHKDARFTEEEVRAIRASKEATQVLADKHGVSLSTIIRIRARKTWKHLE